MTEKVDITKITETQIKAMLYDEQCILRLAKNNIDALQQELKRRQEKSTNMDDKSPTVEGEAV